MLGFPELSNGYIKGSHTRVSDLGGHSSGSKLIVVGEGSGTRRFGGVYPTGIFGELGISVKKRTWELLRIVSMV